MSPIAATTIDVVIPVHNEAAVLRSSVETLLDYLDRELPFRSRVIVADNASTDGTGAIARELAAEHEPVESLILPQKGRGLALRTAWLGSDADVVSYMDVDLSTNLNSFLPLVAPLVAGHSQVAIGTRLVRSAHVSRKLKREVLSRGYNLVVDGLFHAVFSDAQCGFKALRADAARQLVPHVADNGWFFDTELLLLAQRNGMRIHEVPVDWVEDLDSRVHLASTIRDDLRGLWRVRRSFWHGEDRYGDPSLGLNGRDLGKERHTIGAKETMARDESAGIVDPDEGGGLSPTLLKGGGRASATAGRGVAG